MWEFLFICVRITFCKTCWIQRQELTTDRVEQDYPMVHPSLQDRDFDVLQDGDPIFMSLDGGCKLFARSDYEDIRDISKVHSPPKKQQLDDEGVETVAVAQVKGSEQAMERALFPFFINEVAPLVRPTIGS